MCAYACQNFPIDVKNKELENGLGHLEKCVLIFQKFYHFSGLRILKTYSLGCDMNPHPRKKYITKSHTLMAAGTG